MSRWDPLQQRYGFGAACVPLSPPSVARDRQTPPLLQGLRAIRAERTSGDTLRGCLRAAPPMLAGVVIALLLAMLTQPNEDTTIVPFAELPVIQEEPPVEIAETPVPPPVEPEPLPEPEAVAEPPRPEPVVAQAPPPAEPVIAEPPAPRPRPSVPALALAEPTPPPPTPTRARPRATPRPAPAARPDLALDQLAAEQPPEPVRNTRSAPRFAKASSRNPRPDLRATAAPPAAQAPDSAAPTRRARPAPRADAPRRQRAPALEAPGGQLPGHDDAPAPAPTRRPARTLASARTPARRPRPNLSGPSAPTAEGHSPTPRGGRTKPTRVAAPAAPTTERRGGSRDSLSGVPLASLASCVSDAKEQALKQRILAAVGSRGSCKSPVGRYHFVETKNLNAFLMRIERASGRRVGDRCAELTYALDCLSR
jgi:hypothetical protein